MKLALAVLVSALSVHLAKADDPDPLTKSSHYFMGFFGRSELIFGSEDSRFGGGLSYAYGKPEKRFQLGHIPAQLVYEGYVDHTQSGGSGFPPNSTLATGGLGYARWRWPMDQQGNGVYVDLGWGMQFANRPTLDLDTRLNSTPVLGLGGVFRDGSKEFLIGLRYLHISNAGTNHPNFGQNEIFLTLGVRY